MNEKVLVRHHQHFPVHVSEYIWKDSDKQNQSLASYARDLREGETTIRRSNIGGFHSEANIFTNELMAVEELRHKIQFAVQRSLQSIESANNDVKQNFLLSGWVNVIDAASGSYHRVHNHGTALYSGVYYVQTGIGEGGQIEFLDANNLLFGRRQSDGPVNVTHDPIPGLLLLFPGWLPHMVHPYHGSIERVSISFNLFSSEFVSSLSSYVPIDTAVC